MPTVPTQPFDFAMFKQIWKTHVLEEDKDSFNYFAQNNPLLHETLLMQGSALAVLDIQSMKYPIILGDVENLCGWPIDFFYETGVEGFVSKILPEDFLGVGEISKQINAYVLTLNKSEVSQFRAIYDYRMQRKDGSIVTILQESTVLKTDDQGRMTFCLAYISNITYFKREGKQHLRLLGGKKELIFEIDHQAAIQQLPPFTKREKEIAQLICKGTSSEDIADLLKISLFTVNTHRQNMLRKYGFVDTVELINFLKLYRLV